MVDISYGKSSGQRTSKGRRRAARMQERRDLISSGADVQIFTDTVIRKAEVISGRSALAPHLRASNTFISFRTYSGDISRDGCDAIHKVVNHAHQRRPNKKWS